MQANTSTMRCVYFTRSVTARTNSTFAHFQPSTISRWNFWAFFFFTSVNLYVYFSKQTKKDFSNCWCVWRQVWYAFSWWWLRLCLWKVTGQK